MGLCCCSSLVLRPPAVKGRSYLGVGCRFRLPQGSDQPWAPPAAHSACLFLFAGQQPHGLSGLLSPSCHKLSFPGQATRDKDPSAKVRSCLRPGLWEPGLLHRKWGMAGQGLETRFMKTSLGQMPDEGPTLPWTVVNPLCLAEMLPYAPVPPA